MRTYRRLHRTLGISAVTFLILFVITGLLIQHAPRFNLDTSYAPAAIAEWLYGITVDINKSYRVGGHRLAHAGHFIYLDGVPVASATINNLQGAVESATGIWIVGDNKLWIISKRGEVLDELSALSGLPGLVTGIGQDARGNIIVSGLHNNWQAEGSVDGDTSDWKVYAGHQVRWSVPDSTPRAALAHREAIRAHARSHLISIERVLLDLHSGRLFGTAGVLVADAAAFLLLFISVTGILLWLQRK